MTILIFILLTILPIITSSSLAVEIDKYHTDIFLFTTDKGIDFYLPAKNGFFWNELNLEQKASILLGIHNGEYLILLKAYENRTLSKVTDAIEESIRSDEITGFNFNELAKQIDMFYQDSANLKIPFIEAYRYISKRIRGASPQELDNFAASLRKKYNQR
ncbi:MAG: hypothetical protein AABY14_00230 [Nanoarchaeota archaeon]